MADGDGQATEITQPKVFIGIATGPAKEYALHQMVASLRMLDWQNLEIHWSTTHFNNAKSERYKQQLIDVMHTVDWQCDWSVHTTYIEYVDNVKNIPRQPNKKAYYDPVVKNLRKLRGTFLDGDCDYFLELGGDNPPLRNTVKHLLGLNADVAFAVCYQRPREERSNPVGFPLVFVYTWTLEELERFQLDPYLMGKFKLAWANMPMLIPLKLVKNYKRKRYLTEFASGTGCVLIKRHVLERVGWRLPPSRYASEDLYFCHQCHLHGFKLKIDMKFFCPHYHEDGMVY